MNILTDKSMIVAGVFAAMCGLAIIAITTSVSTPKVAQKQTCEQYAHELWTYSNIVYATGRIPGNGHTYLPGQISVRGGGCRR